MNKTKSQSQYKYRPKVLPVFHEETEKKKNPYILPGEKRQVQSKDQSKTQSKTQSKDQPKDQSKTKSIVAQPKDQSKTKSIVVQSKKQYEYRPKTKENKQELKTELIESKQKHKVRFSINEKESKQQTEKKEEKKKEENNKKIENLSETVVTILNMYLRQYNVKHQTVGSMFENVNQKDPQDTNDKLEEFYEFMQEHQQLIDENPTTIDVYDPYQEIDNPHEHDIYALITNDTYDVKYKSLSYISLLVVGSENIESIGKNWAIIKLT